MRRLSSVTKILRWVVLQRDMPVPQAGPETFDFSNAPDSGRVWEAFHSGALVNTMYQDEIPDVPAPRKVLSNDQLKIYYWAHRLQEGPLVENVIFRCTLVSHDLRVTVVNGMVISIAAHTHVREIEPVERQSYAILTRDIQSRRDHV